MTTTSRGSHSPACPWCTQATRPAAVARRVVVALRQTKRGGGRRRLGRLPRVVRLRARIRRDRSRPALRRLPGRPVACVPEAQAGVAPLRATRRSDGPPRRGRRRGRSGGGDGDRAAVTTAPGPGGAPPSSTGGAARVISDQGNVPPIGRGRTHPPGRDGAAGHRTTRPPGRPGRRDGRRERLLADRPEQGGRVHRVVLLRAPDAATHEDRNLAGIPVGHGEEQVAGSQQH